ncbi:MAG: hypothetical protein MJ104_08485 [Lachnospiraceae bacterium]|nr:hypothetical protein [Lachnospiraceae bacterium]
MRHIIIRSIMAIVWVVAAIASIATANYMMTLVYGVVGVAFGLNARKMYLQKKEDGEI